MDGVRDGGGAFAQRVDAPKIEKDENRPRGRNQIRASENSGRKSNEKRPRGKKPRWFETASL